MSMSCLSYVLVLDVGVVFLHEEGKPTRRVRYPCGFIYAAGDACTHNK